MNYSTGKIVSGDKLMDINNEQRELAFNNSKGYTQFEMEVKKELYKIHGDDIIDVLREKDKNMNDLFRAGMSVEDVVNYYSSFKK